MSSNGEAPESSQILAGAKYPDPSSSSSSSTSSSSSPSSSSSTAAPSAADVLGAGGLYAQALHPLANVKSGELDYLLLDDDALNQLEGTQSVLPSRGWSDELCYGTGTTYLTGLAVGGLWGLREGIGGVQRTNPSALGRGVGVAAAATAKAATDAATKAQTETQTPPQTPPPRTRGPSSLRLRWNTVLNAVTRRGSFIGNHAGVLALMYNAVNASLDQYRGKHDVYGSMAAGGMTGMIWRSTQGVRPACIAAGGLATLAGIWTQVKRTILYR